MKNRIYNQVMSIRIFEKIQFDAHNHPMSDRHQAQAYPLRMPDDLKARVAESAKANGRSMNAEIIARLDASFAGPADHLNDVQDPDVLNTLQMLQEDQAVLRAKMDIVLKSLGEPQAAMIRKKRGK